ncbi:uncharacterized protein MKZ38_003601 [Zalerion maritima]|uniref:Ysc84 actin-binding domain-containing protein n=1 Tax=Zalerion maritima TaxID=339359 RepID=A0AAD5RNT5_9PEZI|nr:uncharacterized protein MKZ38_003601 [Zalerion maritima]
MQRVSALLPTWDQSKARFSKDGASGGNGFGKAFSWAGKRSSTTPSIKTDNDSPSTAITTRASKESFWPSPLNQECDKAARILKSFCSEGFLASEDDSGAPLDMPQSPARVLKKIPAKVIQNAVALAVFTCMRSGLWITGSGGSGILIARKADGTWSPPSGIMLHTPVLSFVIDVDVYDCVLVINDFAVLETFTRPSITLGSDVSIGTGPLVGASQPDHSIRWSQFGNSVYSYLKSRGVNTRIQLDGSILTERMNENERFYTSPVPVLDVLAGNVRRDVPELKPLTEMLKAAEGRSDFDAELIARLSSQASPGDMTIESPKTSPVSPVKPIFGVPAVEDPDPFGVLALEMAGLEIREAGTKLRPESSQFEYNPAPTSPLFAQFRNRQSIDTFLSRSNRGSYMSSRTLATDRTQMTDAFTQTDVGETPNTTPSPGQSEDGRDRSSIRSHPALREQDEEDYTKIDTTPIRHLSYEAPKDRTVVPPSPEPGEPESSSTPTTQASSTCVEEDENEDADDEDEEEEEPVVFEVATAAPPQRTVISKAAQVIQVKGALVNIPKRVPPPLPLRSPARLSRNSKSSFGDISALGSPLKQSFTDTESPVESDACLQEGTKTIVSSHEIKEEMPGMEETLSQAEQICDIVRTEVTVTSPTKTEVSEDSPQNDPEVTEKSTKAGLDVNASGFRPNHKHSSSIYSTAKDTTPTPSLMNSNAVTQLGLTTEVQQEAVATYSSEDGEDDESKTPAVTPAVVESKKEEKGELAVSEGASTVAGA